MSTRLDPGWLETLQARPLDSLSGEGQSQKWQPVDDVRPETGGHICLVKVTKGKMDVRIKVGQEE